MIVLEPIVNRNNLDLMSNASRFAYKSTYINAYPIIYICVSGPRPHVVLSGPGIVCAENKNEMRRVSNARTCQPTEYTIGYGSSHHCNTTVCKYIIHPSNLTHPNIAGECISKIEGEYRQAFVRINHMQFASHIVISDHCKTSCSTVI